MTHSMCLGYLTHEAFFKDDIRSGTTTEDNNNNKIINNYTSIWINLIDFINKIRSELVHVP